MSRLPYLGREALDDRGRALWDELVETRGPGVVNAEGGLSGPFNAFVTSSKIGGLLLDLGHALRFDTSIDRRLLELAIITVGAHWRSEFEWWAHSRMARDYGVADEVIDAIANGIAPEFENEADRAVHAAAAQLGIDGRLDADTYAAAHAVLGNVGLVELVALCGYYTLVCFTLNAFDVPLPSGQARTWPE